MALAISTVVLGLMFFVAIVNLFYISGEYRNKTKEELKKINIFNSRNAWLVYSIIIGIALCFIIFIAFSTIMAAIASLGNTE